ncbi:MAG: TRAP transporter substrate-binding protein DctP [Oscillospiraceae bacterium]|nr:TRAP transporter substrate-binding protein DctP [Oscillospiraceae bacterium]
MKRPISIILVLVLALALFAGCGGGGGGNAAATPPPASGGSAATPPPASGSNTNDPAPKDEPVNINLTFAIYLGDTDPTTLDNAHYLDMIRDYTDGTVDYTMYPSQTLCNGDEELDAVRSGLADVTFFPVAYGAGQLPVASILEYPGFAFNSDKAASYAFREWFNVLDLPELSDFKLLYAIGQGNGGFMTTFNVDRFDDLVDKQIRCMAAFVPIFEAYSIFPTVMVFSEVYEALRTGVVQGFYGMMHAGNVAKLYEVTSCVTLDPYFISSYIMVMNKDVWNSLSAGQKEAIEAATDDAFNDFLAPGRAADALIAIDIFADNGLKILRLSDEDIAKMGELNSPIQENYAKGVNGGPEALALYRELSAKYNAVY